MADLKHDSDRAAEIATAEKAEILKALSHATHLIDLLDSLGRCRFDGY